MLWKLIQEVIMAEREWLIGSITYDTEDLTRMESGVFVEVYIPEEFLEEFANLANKMNNET